MVKLLFLLLFFYPCLTGIPQVCTGSLGDPTVHITFGTGANPGPALPAGTTSYNYASKDCPADGEYAIRNLTFTCYSDSWYTVPFDHTPGDGNNGYYMQINGGDNGRYYTNTLSGLCPNTTYELSFWVMNLSKPGVACEGNATDPDIKYIIENSSGLELATARTGAVTKGSEAAWKQYSLIFKTDASTSVVLRLLNNATGGCGMDFLLDDITVRPCGPSIVAVIAESGLQAAKGCESDTSSILLHATVGSGFRNPSYQWQKSVNTSDTWTDIPGANSLSYVSRPGEKGNYRYRLLAGEGIGTQCRFGSNPVEIIIDGTPYAQGTNYSYCLGKDVTLFAAGGVKYSWTGPNGFASNQQSPVLPRIQFSDSGLYRVQVTNSAGCKGSDSTNLSIFSNPVALVNPDISICEGGSAALLAGGGTEYYWAPAKGLSSVSVPNPVARPSDTTLYTVHVTRYGCADTATVKVNVWKKPLANAGPDKKIRKGQAVLLSASVKGTDIDYFWTPSLHINNTRILNPAVTPTEDITYRFHVTSNKGCGASTDDVIIKVYDKINIPNAFSPNGDGVNDTWIIEPLELFGDTETQVFNRYGQVIFQSRGYNKPWDGKRNSQPLPTGVYYYTIDMKDGKPLLTGSVMIVR